MNLGVEDRGGMAVLWACLYTVVNDLPPMVIVDVK